ncbi:MAG: ribosome biogenesis GTPase Der [Gemmatimonadetes bacterium]|nr:ribosome biogenesis GTPase Der [Gemmatimonadota bacterium]
MSRPVVAIIGRPNVGKSSLFNRIIGTDSAIVDDEAGTTRDRHFAAAEWGGRQFWLVDTGGLRDDPAVPMDREIRRQVEVAIDEADLMMLVLDATAGLHPSDGKIVAMLRASGKPWLVVANKVDDPRNIDFFELYNLGAGDPIPVSALNGKNSGDLLDELVKRLPARDASPADEALRVAVIGRPNVGKSSLINKLLGEARHVVSEESGTTRDAIDSPFTFHGKELIFVDTAGLRRQARVDDGVEFYSSLRTRRAIDRADICLLLIDAVEGLHNQDLKIAALAWEAGRGLIMIVNKWDLKEKGDKTSAHFQKECGEKAPFLNFVPFLFTSALTGQRVTKTLDVIIEVNAERHKRISTSQVNDGLRELVARLQPPQQAGAEVRLNYATQVDAVPPTIAIFGNHPEFVAEHYIRYLHNGFRGFWGFKGNPLRIVMRLKSGRNPT